MEYNSKARLAIIQRLGDSWRDLALYLDIPPYEVARFPRGHEADAVLRWLEERKKLDWLPAALEVVGRGDLAVEMRIGQLRAAQAPGASSPERSRVRVLLVVAGAALVAILTISVALTLINSGRADSDATRTPSGDDADGSSCSGTDCIGTPQRTEGPFEARIHQTMDVNTGSFIGLKSYRDPSDGGKGTEIGFYPENATVYVVCALRRGREIEDLPWEDRPLSSRTWYKLTVPGPHWVPSMYVRLLPLPGQTEVPVPPDCDE